MDTDAHPHASPGDGIGNSEDRLAFLANAGLLLSASLDFDKTLESVARLAVPFFADCCSVEIQRGDGRLQRLTVVHVSPESAPQVRHLWRRGSSGVSQKTIKTRRIGQRAAAPAANRVAEPKHGTYSARPDDSRLVLLVHRIAADRASQIQDADRAQRRVLQLLEVRSQLTVPLVVRGESIGTLTFATTAVSDRRFLREDLPLAEELAARAAVAIDNAGRFQEERRKAEPAALLEMLLSALPIGFAFLDTEVRFARISRSFAAMSAVPAEEHVGRHAVDVLGRGLWSRISPLYRRALAGETILDQEISVPESVARDDRHRMASFCPVRDADGRVLGVGVVVLDITEHKRAELARAAGEARFRSLISATTQLIWTTDAEGRLTDWHDWHMFTGQPVQDIADSTPETWLGGAVHPEAQQAVLSRFTQALTSGKACELECQLCRFDGDYLYFALRAVPVRDEENGRIIEWVGAGTNITHHREAERAREEALTRETRIAQTLQRALLVRPSGSAFPGLEFETLYQPAYDAMLVGGDFYDAFPLDGDRVAFVIGDLSGKGLEAAAHTAEVKFTLRTLLRDVGDAELAVARLNAYLREGDQFTGLALPGHLVALTIAVLSPTDEQAEFLVAGMEPPLILRGAGSMAAARRGPGLLRAETVRASGLPLGVPAEWDEKHAAARVPFGPNDLLLLSTDGLSEVRRRGTRADFFGIEGVIEAALTAALQQRKGRPLLSLEEIGSDIVRAATDFAGGHLHDDVCLLLARRRPPEP